MANLLPYPYDDTTMTRDGVTYTDMGDGRIKVGGAASSPYYSYFSYHLLETFSLPAGTYTMRGTGSEHLENAITAKDASGNYLLVKYTADDFTFTLAEDAAEVTVALEVSEAEVEIGGVVVYPQIVEGSALTPWVPYVGPTTIDAENAKQIRRSMDVLITVAPESGDPIVIDNDNLVSCVVSLRSDLSILEPTLPESEINIEAYFDDDISDVLASIPDETPVTYQAGYDGDMSPVRNFYLAEQITWADNVMQIHAVDAVHKLDEEIGTALYTSSHGPGRVAGAVLALIKEYTGVDAFSGTLPYLPAAGNNLFLVDDGFTARDLVAQMNWLLHQENEIWYTYVDAGIPVFTPSKPSSKWDIFEEDCGDIQRNTDRKIANLTVQLRTLRQIITPEAGSATIIRNVGTSLSFNSSYVRGLAIGVGKNTRDDDLMKAKFTTLAYTDGVLPLIPVTKSGLSNTTNFPLVQHASVAGLQRMLKDGLGQEDFSFIGTPGSSYSEIYTQFVPWACAYDSSDTYWNDNPDTTDIRSQTNARTVLANAKAITSTDDAEIAIGGYVYEPTIEPETYTSASGEGVSANIDDPPWFGAVQTAEYGIAYPDQAYQSLLRRSNVTGQFTWKGDPRMQPRDVVTLHRLDGTTEEITLENITITHEKGGTSAEITYRKGIC